MKFRVRHLLLILLPVLVPLLSAGYNHADTLRGSNGRGRIWWDVLQYNLTTRFDMQEQSITGQNEMIIKITGTIHDSLQIDLQEPMVLDSVLIDAAMEGMGGDKALLAKDGNVWWVKYPFSSKLKESKCSVTLFYHGAPRAAINPPWDGGISWKKDSLGQQWIAVSCQGLGASVWWPCKDAQWDEPDDGMTITLEVPNGMQAVSNGRMISTGTGDGYTATTWEVVNPINNYDVTFYIGDYVHWSDTLMGEKGLLDLDFYALSYHEAIARKHFEVVKQMIHCFEYWMGPYPFYEDGYKLVESPYLGMEHQGAIAYGNNFKKGYRGMDRSMTGIGLAWDYIIIHESGHEWFGNNVTARDMADNWIHEGITSYSEALFTECLLGKEQGMAYSRGLWHLIKNQGKIVADYGVNEEGVSDIYEKGEAVMHMIRVMTGNDEQFRQMLRGIGKQFYHAVVTTKEIEDYIAQQTGLDLKPFFDQYLRTTDIPRLEYSLRKNVLKFRFKNTVPGFSLPIAVKDGGNEIVIKPTSEWQETKWKGGYNIQFSNDFLMNVKN